MRTSREDIKFCRRVGERGGEEPRPMLVGFHRKEDRNELMEKAKELRHTDFKEVTIVPDMTPHQRKEETEMAKEAERRNETRTEEERSKNVEWMVVGRKGEKRLIKGVARQWGGEMRGRGTWRTERGGGTVRGGRGRGSSLPPGRGLLPGRGGQSNPSGRPETEATRGIGPARRGETLETARRGMGWRGTEDRERRNSKRTRGESDTEIDRDSRPPPAKH